MSPIISRANKQARATYLPLLSVMQQSSKVSSSEPQRRLPRGHSIYLLHHGMAGAIYRRISCDRHTDCRVVAHTPPPPCRHLNAPSQCTMQAEALRVRETQDVGRLAQLGYKQELSRQLSAFHNFATTLSFLSPITGLTGTYAYSAWGMMAPCRACIHTH
jgi:hypothetical protein